jgi:hypothetical protein
MNFIGGTSAARMLDTEPRALNETANIRIAMTSSHVGRPPHRRLVNATHARGSESSPRYPSFIDISLGIHGRAGTIAYGKRSEIAARSVKGLSHVPGPMGAVRSVYSRASKRNAFKTGDHTTSNVAVTTASVAPTRDAHLRTEGRGPSNRAHGPRNAAASQRAR